MSVRTLASEEFKRSPLAVTATIAGVVVSALALLVAWLQYAGQPVVASSPPQLTPGRLHVSNFLVCAGFFVAANFSLASLTRLLARRHAFAALVLSVPAAVLASFGTMIIFVLVPPKELNSESLAQVKDMVFYGTAFVFVALNGQPVMQSMFEPDPAKLPSPEVRAGDGFAVLVGALILLGIWGSFVSGGLTKLVQVLL